MNPEESWLRKSEVYLAWLRVGFSFLLVIVLQFALDPAAKSRSLWYFASYGFLLYSLIVPLYLRLTQAASLDIVRLISTSLDLIGASLIAISALEINGSLLVCSLFPVITATIRYGLKGSLAVAATELTLYGLMRAFSVLDPTTVADFYILQSIFLAILAIIIGVLGETEKSYQKDLLRLYQTAADSARDEERRRLSRELHDRILQLIASIGLRAEYCREHTRGKQQELDQELQTIEEAATSASTELRNLLVEKQAHRDLVSGTLERRLNEEMDIFRARTGLKLEFQCAINKHNLAYEVERELYFSLREGILNAIRHSRATELKLSLIQSGATCEAILKDNGVGFDLPSTEGGSHYGLKGMRERIKKVGGRMEIQTAPGKGTEISIAVPAKA